MSVDRGAKFGGYIFLNLGGFSKLMGLGELNRRQRITAAVAAIE
ncbi:MAG TPA: hypothetical protein VFQ43_12995 [Nitrososphaera sp.]|nr:hypothetical protein [Nitrososphaera sp.]